MRKPADLIYGVEDTPPKLSLLLLGLQHVVLLITSLLASVFFARELGLAGNQAQGLVNVGLLAGGAATILQALVRGPVGSGYFCPHSSSFIYLQTSLMAVHTGGLALVHGMTMVSGVAEVGLAWLVRRLRALFPAEVSGLVVASVGFTLAPYAMKSLLGCGGLDCISEPREIWVGVSTLALVVALSVWGKGWLRLYSIGFGVAFGYVAGWLAGLIPPQSLQKLAEMPLVDFPVLDHAGFSFDATLLGPFLLAALCASLKAVGDVITCQKINDADWLRPDMKNVGRGLAAEGLGTVAAGLLGGTGLSSSSSNIGLSLATGATSRRLGLATGGLFMALAFLPQFATLLTMMPSPVTGAIIMYAACFMLVTGWRIIMTRMIDARKTFVIGLSLLAGITVQTSPELFLQLNHWMQPIFTSSLTISALFAVILNLIFRLGIRSRILLTLAPGQATGRDIQDFFERAGATWGARRDVVYRALASVTEFWEAAEAHALASGDIAVRVKFDELSLDVEISYRGREICLPLERPTQEEMLELDDGFLRLAGFLIMQMGDRVKSETKDGACRLLIHFDH
ncbi:MAG: purine/pyrimidine permease [Deltaproteobacteria bacterium]|nr:purine/pyrimidine permease [Deltaproteobacteria bacterium]